MFSKDDLVKHGQLKNVIQKGRYDLQGDAIVLVASLLQWYSTLDDRIKKSIELPSEPKMIEPSIMKMDGEA